MAEARPDARDVAPPVSRQAECQLELTLVSFASPEMWMGRWVAKDVEVDIGKIGPALPGQPLTAAVKDSTVGELFSFVHSFLPGPERAVCVARPLKLVEGAPCTGSVQVGGGAADLDNYVVLRLYEAVYDGESFGLRLGYKRYATSGATICDVLLSLCAKIH